MVEKVTAGATGALGNISMDGYDSADLTGMMEKVTAGATGALGEIEMDGYDYNDLSGMVEKITSGATESLSKIDMEGYSSDDITNLTSTITTSTTNSLGNIKMDGFDKDNIPTDITNSVTSGSNSGTLLQPPIVKELTAVATPTKDNTPSYTFKSSKAGTITYGGNCRSDNTTATADNNTITFTTLSDGTYSNCNLYVTTSTGVKGNTLSVTPFTVDTTAPTLAPVTTVTTPTNDPTPSYAFSSDEAGTISYGGSCSSTTTVAISGTNSILFNLSEGTHSNCTITVTDSLGHVSNPLSVNTFVVDTTAPTLAQVTAVTTPTKDTTPSYAFSSDEAGIISYGGSSCSPGETSAVNGTNSISFGTLIAGSYTCSITVTDTAGNASSPLSVNTFIVDTTTGLVWDQGYWDFHNWQ